MFEGPTVKQEKNKVNKTLELQSSISQKQICPVFPACLEYYLLQMENLLWLFIICPRRRYHSVAVKPEKGWLSVRCRHIHVKPSILVTGGQRNTAGVFVTFSFFVIVFL